MKISDIKPTATAKRTNSKVNNPGITYNEAGVTYNDARYTYGGVYGQDISPMISLSSNLKPKATMQKTNVLVSDPGITYNEAGVTYNDPRYVYGGLYGQNVIPLFSFAITLKPRIVFSGDIYTNALIAFRLAENGDFRILENGDFRILE